MAFKLNPISGQLDLVGTGGSSSPDNFSYEIIVAAATVTIPLYQQMIVHGNIQIDGVLVADGPLVVI